jgi:hypothetical protein
LPSSRSQPLVCSVIPSGTVNEPPVTTLRQEYCAAPPLSTVAVRMVVMTGALQSFHSPAEQVSCPTPQAFEHACVS